MTVKGWISALATVTGFAASQSASNLRGATQTQRSNTTNEISALYEVLVSSTILDGNRAVSNASWNATSAVGEIAVRNITTGPTTLSNLTLRTASASLPPCLIAPWLPVCGGGNTMPQPWQTPQPWPTPQPRPLPQPTPQPTPQHIVPSPQRQITGGKIKLGRTGLCMAHDSHFVSINRVKASACYGGSEQMWTVRNSDIKSYANAECLDYSLSYFTKGRVNLRSCHGRQNQKWEFTFGLIKSLYDGRCVEYDNSDKYLLMAPCNVMNTNQQWQLDQ